MSSIFPCRILYICFDFFHCACRQKKTKTNIQYSTFNMIKSMRFIWQTGVKKVRKVEVLRLILVLNCHIIWCQYLELHRQSNVQSLSNRSKLWITKCGCSWWRAKSQRHLCIISEYPQWKSAVFLQRQKRIVKYYVKKFVKESQ